MDFAVWFLWYSLHRTTFEQDHEEEHDSNLVHLAVVSSTFGSSGGGLLLESSLPLSLGAVCMNVA